MFSILTKVLKDNETFTKLVILLDYVIHTNIYLTELKLNEDYSYKILEYNFPVINQLNYLNPYYLLA